MRRREFLSLGQGNVTTRIHHALRQCNGGYPLAARAQPCASTGVAFIRVCSDGSGYSALQLFGGASWIGDSPLASLERD